MRWFFLRRLKHYTNPPGSPRYKHGFINVIRELWEYFCAMFGFYRHRIPKNFLPIIKATKILNTIRRTKNAITWLGHSSFLIKLNGITVLTDPFLSMHAAHYQPFGPRRITPPALTVKQLPRIDVIIISHGDYDHCDRSTLKKIAGKYNCLVLVPPGLQAYLRSWGFKNIKECKWNTHIIHRSLTFTALPAIHHTRRGLFDQNTSFWMGMSIKNKTHHMYFAGDTAYSDIFKKIGKRYGPFDYGLVPIGAYKPEHRLHSIHATPEDALRIGKDVEAQKLIGMHWGALALTAEPADEPPQRFHAGAAAAGYAADNILTLSLGETITL